MEETHKIEYLAPFDPRYLHEPILRYQKIFLAEILKLGIIPAHFPTVMAKLYWHVNQRSLSEVNATELQELRTLMPEIKQPFYDQLPLVPACDLFSDAQLTTILQTTDLHRDAECLRPIAVQVARLLRISDQLSADRTLTELLLNLVEYYESFRNDLCAPLADKAELLTPKAYICGIDLQYYEISHDMALRIICRKANGESNRENKFGNHPGVKINQTYCKPVGISDTLGTGKENAAVKFCQLFSRENRVATPVTLLKVSHVQTSSIGFDERYLSILKYYNNKPYMERIVQAAMLCEGELLQIVLELIEVFQTWHKTHGDEVLVQLLTEKNLPILMNSSGLDDKAKQDVPLYLETMQRIIKDYTPELAVKEMHKLLNNLDSYSLCTLILSNIILNATDLKADNIMLCWDDSSGVRKFYFEVIDGDLIWQHPTVNSKSGHYFTLRCILLLFNLNIPFNAKLRGELLEHPAIYYILSWVQLVFADEEQFDLRVQQRAFTESDLFIEEMSTVDKPLRFHPTTLPRMLALLQRAQNILSENAEITLATFFNMLTPLYAQYHQVVTSPFADNILAAYSALNNGPAVEKALCAESLQEYQFDDYSSLDVKNQTTLNCKAAIVALIATFEHKMGTQEEIKFLEYIGTYFPFIKHRPYEKLQINELLLKSADYMLPNAMRLLLACGGDANYANNLGQRLLHVVMSHSHLDMELHGKEIINLLLSQVTINLQHVNAQNETPLITFILHAKNYSYEFIEFLLSCFKTKHADLNHISHLGSALDVAVSMESITVFAILVNLGAYALKEPGKAVKFVRKFQGDLFIKAAVKILSVSNPNFHYKRALNLVTRTKKDKDHIVLINGEYHRHCYLENKMAQLLFNKQGDLNYDNAVTIGNYKFIEIQWEGELLFYAVVYSRFPGIEIAVTRLHRILGSFTATYSEVFQCTNQRNESFPLMLTGAVMGDTLTTVLQNPVLKQDVLVNIDRNNLTKLIFIQMLLGQVFGSTNNIIVVENPEQKRRRFCLVYILNDAPFAPKIIADEEVSTNIFHYLEPFLSVPLDPRAIEEITNLSARGALNDWLEMLGVHEDQMNTFFRGKDRGVLQSVSGNGVSLMGVPLRPGTIKTLFVRAKTLCEILQKNTNPEFNGWDFLRCAQTLFKNQSKPEPIISESPRGKAFNIAMMTSPRRLINLKTRRTSQSTPISMSFIDHYSSDAALRAKFSVDAAMQELKEIEQDDTILQQAIVKLQCGKFDSFDRLILDYFKQAAVNAIVWKQMEPHLAESLLKHIIQADIHFTELRIIDCHELHQKTLKMMLKNSPDLRSLNLSGSKKINTKLYKYITEYCTNIEEIILDRTLITELSLDALQCLQRVSVANCINLAAVKIYSTVLSELNLSGSNVVRLTLNPEACSLVKLNVNGCSALNVSDLEEVLLSSKDLQEFQHVDVSPANLGGYVRSVLREKLITPAISKSLVHGGVLNFYGMPIHDEQLQHIIDHLIFPDKFALILHPSQIITSVNLQGCQNISRTAIAKLIMQVRTLESLIPNGEVEPIYLGFCKCLPTSLKTYLRKNVVQTSYLELEYKDELSKIERQAIDHLYQFIIAFFADKKYTVIKGSDTIVILNCPLEELCMYQMMFDAILQRAERSPRKLLASDQRMTVTLGRDMSRALSVPNDIQESIYASK